MSENFVVISGCSGGGKSTLLTALAGLGYTVVQEPGRRIVADQLEGGGSALPWVDLAAFARRAVELALGDRERMRAEAGWVFFDRGLIDAASALDLGAGGNALGTLGAVHRYHPTVFMTPPWEEIFASDAERRHGFEEAVAEYERLCAAYPQLGYRIIELPRVGVDERAAFVLETLEGARASDRY